MVPDHLTDERIEEQANNYPDGTAAEVRRLRTAIRQHRDERGNGRCHADDGRLYAVLPEGDTRPARETAVTLENCARYIECRQTGREYVSPQRRIEELVADVATLTDRVAWHAKLCEETQDGMRDAEAELTSERDTLHKLVEDMRAYVLHHGILIGECVAWEKLKQLTGVGQS